jgi:predicted nucleotidyltransferase
MEMDTRTVPEARCYRCVYRWTPHRLPPRICPRCKSKLWNVPKLRPVRLGRALGIKEILGPHRREVIAIARKHGYGHVKVFGSVRRREATSSSDVDLMVTPIRRTSLLDKAALEVEPEELLGRNVDVVYEGSLHWAMRPQAEFEAMPL